MNRYNSMQQAEVPKGLPVSALDAARANDFFESFLNANTLKTILGTYRSICDLLHLKPNALPSFYPRLKEHLTSWRAKALWKKFDARANNKCYGKGKMCSNTRVLIIGAGPCGLRTAIEAQLLGAKVVVVEKRDRISRNNVLHLWPFVIDDLRLLGAKKFFGKFCAGAIDHISIRQLQCILLKVALLLGVEIHTEVSFEYLIEPNPDEKTGWKAAFKPIDHPVNQFEFDVVIGADGKRNTLQGFKRKEFRGKLAIAITANFINKRTEAEARVEEISGVAFIFNQKFFKDLFAETGIDLENIVYYKDDTHYFVMTAKKQSLIEKGVIKQDLQDTAKLLAHENVDRNALMNYAREAAEFSTNYMMLDLEFAVNHYGQPDVAMFDFTSMYQAENASRIIERHGYKLLSILVGDSLLEPFWPTGSGCARGFLSSLDAGWAIKGYGSRSVTPLEVLAERESIYRLLPQTTPENLNRDYKSYTLDPSTRYPNLNRNLLLPQQVISLFDTDDPGNVVDNPNKRRRRDSHVDRDTLLAWIRDQVKEHEDLEVANVTSSFRDGRVLCAVISHYRPDLLDYSTITIEDAVGNNKIAFDLLEKELGIPAVMSAEDMVEAEEPDFRTMVAYLTLIYDTFRGEIPHVKHPKLRALSATRKYLDLPNTECSSSTFPPNLELSQFSVGDSPKHIVELFRSKWINSSQDNSSLSSYGENNHDHRPHRSKVNKPDVLVAELDADRNVQTVGSGCIHAKLALLAESKRLQTYIGKKAFKSKKLSSDKKCALKVDAFTDVLSSIPSMTKCVQTDHNFPIVVKVNQYCNCTCNDKALSQSQVCPKNLNIVVKDEKAIHSFSYDTKVNCLYIMVPDFLRKMRSNLIHKRQIDVLKSLHVCKRHDFLSMNKFLSIKMIHANQAVDVPVQDYNFDRVVNWISASNFNYALTGTESPKSASVPNLDGLTDITSVTRQKPLFFPKDISSIIFENDKPIQEGADVLDGLVKTLEDMKIKTIKHHIYHADSQHKIVEKHKLKQDANGKFSLILDRDEKEWTESKRHQDAAFTKNHPAIKPAIASHAATHSSNVSAATTHHRPSTRHKRHAETPEPVPHTPPAHERKTRKRRSAMEKIEKITVGSVEERMKRLEEIASNRNERQSKRRQQRKMQTEQFIKSMQMLAANSISEHSEPFEDYSIFLYRQTAPNFEDRVKDLEKKFTYVPEREHRAPVQLRGENDEEFKARIRGMENKVHDITDRKPKGFIRAIGKLENTDWNIREIEKKIIENKMGKNINKDKEKVPKWSKEQFQARQMKMEKQHLERQNSAGDKFAEIDKNIKLLDQRVKEGSIRDLNQKKVAQITEKLRPKTEEIMPIQKSASKTTVVLPNQGKSETCHFCNKRVYLMERLLAEGKFFHRGCFRCQYCHTALRLGSYMFDRDGKYGYRFYCAQHFGMPGEIKQTKIVSKSSQKPLEKTLEKKFLSGVAGVDLLDRDDGVSGQTPERIEFDLSAGHASSDHEEPLSQMDEDEWTDRNFGASTAEIGSSDDDYSSFSESDDDDDNVLEDALEEPPTKEGTLKLLNTLCKKRFSQRNRNESDSDSYSSSDRSSYYENSSGEDDSETATEGEEEIQARERRKMEVQVKPPIVHTDTGTDTEIASDDDTSSSSEVQNSATEISTDSEFAQDDPTPTCEKPMISFNDMFVTKTRGSNKMDIFTPQKVQVKSTEIQKPVLNTANATTAKPDKDIELKFIPLVQTPIRKPVAPPLLLRTEGYALNRTQSTGGIATKVSLELKKKYLLGENNPSTAIQKSGSASTLDSKFKSFHSNISDCQKLLKPSAEISVTMQTFCNKLDEKRTSPISPLAATRPMFKLPEKAVVTSSETTVSTSPLITRTTKNEVIQEQPEVPVVPYESEGRPRSPLHETSIIVPQIDWSQQLKEKQLSSEGTSDTTTSSTDSDENHIQKSPSIKAFNVTPEIEKKLVTLDNNNDNMPLDSLNYISYSKVESQPSSINDPPKSISSEKKALNPPKTLPKLDDLLLAQVHSVLHKTKPVIVEPMQKPEENTEKIISGRSTPSHESGVCQVTAALTETELSDWAHDGMVSDDFAESDYEVKEQERAKDKPVIAKKATITEAENHVLKMKTLVKEPEEEKFELISNILCPTLDNIEFMDTGSESSEEDEVAPAKNNGYVQFHDEDDIVEDSLSPVINNIVEAKSPMIKATSDEGFDALSTADRNTGYCFIADGNQHSYGGEVIDLKPIDLQLLKEKQSMYDNEEDSLIIIEKSTTDDNTCSDSTVKNVTEIAPKEELPPQPITNLIENNNTLDKKRLEDKLAQVKSEMKMISEQRKAAHIEEQNMRNHIEFVQHCQRLQSKVDFGNAKDSIDIRKARRQSKSGSPPKPDLIQEEKEITSPIRSRREQIEMERDKNKKLVQEMVMNKMRAENKSLERKRRNRNFSPNLSPSRPFELNKSPTVDISTHIRQPAPDVLLSTINTPLQKSETVSEFQSDRIVPRTKYSPLSSNNSRPLSAFVTGKNEYLKLTEKSLPNSEAFSMPDIQKAVEGDFVTPKAPPRTKHEGTYTVEKLKEDARARARLLSDEDLGLSPEEKLAKLRVRLARRGKENEENHLQGNVQPLQINAERPTSLFYKNDTLNKKRIASFRRSKSGDDHLNLKVHSQPARERTKSFGETQVKLSLRSTDTNEGKCFKSDPNLLLDSVEVIKKQEKKSKDRERRKSITKLFTDFFAKKKDFNVTSSNSSTQNKGFLSRISPKTKDKSKDMVKEEPVRRMSYTETNQYTSGNVSPPPIPPLPLNYTGAKSIDDSSDGEGEWKRNDRSSCDTLDQSGNQEGLLSSRRSSSRSARKARQSQSKRHRMAQEIQRKLEETDVKTRELELRGVNIEKALRGECESSNKDETVLLKEWFDLMKDITELRRYERELMVRAQELELEDRHARLQHDLKGRLSSEPTKSEKDIETESSIIQEMLDIVAKRDSLIVLLEEERLRYKEEDRILEEQMLAKGVNVSAVVSSGTAAQ